MARRSGVSPDGLLMPLATLFGSAAQRQVCAGEIAPGPLAPTNLLGSQFYDRLRPLSVTARLCAVVLPDLSGAVDIPYFP